MFKYVAAIIAATAAAGPADYSQEGANWGETVPLCKDGREQSPINLTTTGTDTSGKMKLIGYSGYKDFGIPRELVSRSATKVQVDIPTESAGEMVLKLDDYPTNVTLKNLQFHFHAPSEHTVDGKQYDLEVHFVHLFKDASDDPDGDTLGAVIGVFFDRSAGTEESDFLEALWDTSDPVTQVKVQSFLDEVDFSEMWNYKGSLTTPPCTEGIKWTVIKKIQPISDAQLARFTDLWAGDEDFAGGNGNYRIVMPLNDRTLYFNSFENEIMMSATSLTAVVATLSAAFAVLSF